AVFYARSAWNDGDIRLKNDAFVSRIGRLFGSRRFLKRPSWLLLHTSMAYQPDEIDLKIHKRAAQLLGGEAAYQKIADEESKEVIARWNQNTELIGRILRAHLFVEQFLTDN